MSKKEERLQQRLHWIYLVAVLLLGLILNLLLMVMLEGSG